MIIAAVVMALGVSGGLDLFATVVVMGGLTLVTPDGPFPSAAPLASPLLLLPALALWVGEGIAERRPGLDQAWRLGQLVVRPIGAASLVTLLLTGLTGASVFWAAVVAAGLALFTQACRSGWAVRRTLEGGRTGLGRALALEDLLVVVLVASLWWQPWVALAMAATTTAALLLAGPGTLRAQALSGRLVRSWVLGLGRAGGWRSPVDFPGWMKTRLAPKGVVTGGRLRAVQAACLGYPNHRSIRFGWVVVRGPRPLFAYKSGGAAASHEIALMTKEPIRGPLSVSAPISFPSHPDLLLVFPLDGPDPDLLLAELRSQG